MKEEELWNPNAENRIYERIIMRSPAEFSPFTMPFVFTILMLFICFCCCCQSLKYGRDEPCRICYRRLIFRRRVCVWCKFYKAQAPRTKFYKQWQADDLVKRDNIADTRVPFVTQVENFIERGWRQVIKGTDKDEDQYNLESYDMDVGYRRRYPNKKKVVPSELFENDTGIIVVQKTLFDKFGKQEVYPSFSLGSPARETYNMKTRFNLNYFHEAKEAHARGELEPAFKHSGNLMLTQPPSPESDDGMYVEDLDAWERAQKKKDKKKKKKGQTKRILFADDGDTGGTVKFGSSVIEEIQPEGGSFRPSVTAKPVKSALKSSLKRGGRVSFQAPGARFADDVGGKDDDSDDMNFGVDFEALADRAAGQAAARLGYEEDPEEKKENDKKIEVAEQRAIEARIKAKEEEN